MLSLAMGVAFLLNARFVKRFGTRPLSGMSMLGTVILSGVLLIFYFVLGANPPLWLFMTLLLLIFFFTGFAFGNLNAIAMNPLGHIAGVAASTQGFLNGLVTVLVCSLVGFTYNDTIVSLIVGFLCANAVAVYITRTAP